MQAASKGNNDHGNNGPENSDANDNVSWLAVCLVGRKTQKKDGGGYLAEAHGRNIKLLLREESLDRQT